MNKSIKIAVLSLVLAGSINSSSQALIIPEEAAFSNSFVATIVLKSLAIKLLGDPLGLEEMSWFYQAAFHLPVGFTIYSVLKEYTPSKILSWAKKEKENCEELSEEERASQLEYVQSYLEDLRGYWQRNLKNVEGAKEHIEYQLDKVEAVIAEPACAPAA